MSRYVYTFHAEKKLLLPEVKKLKITKKRLENVIKKPVTIDRSEEPVYIAIGNLTRTLSLNVVYKKLKREIRVITFYPAEKGRYERKVLRRG